MTTGEEKTIDLVEVILTQIVEHATVPDDKVNLSIGFPSLTYHIFVEQHPNLINLNVRYAPPPKRLAFDHKFFEGKHVVDVPALEEEIVLRQPRKPDVFKKSSISSQRMNISAIALLIETLEDEKKATNEVIAKPTERRAKLVTSLITLQYEVEALRDDAEGDA